MTQREQDLAMVKQHCEQLIEHFDTVQIFATRCDGTEDGTVAVQLGLGNWYAREGQVREWIVKNDEVARIEARKDEEKD